MPAILLWIIYVGGGLVGGLGSLFLVYTLYLAYVHQKYSHIPSPRRSSFYAGHLPDLWRTCEEVDEEVSIALALNHWTQGVDSDTFVVFFYHLPIIYTLDPEVVKDVMMNPKNERSPRFRNTLASVFGERYMGNGLVTIKSYDEWKQRRRLYDPAFSTTYLKTLTATFNEIINSTMDKIEPLADGKTKVPLKNYIMQLSMDIISKAAFGSDFSKIWTANSLGIQIPPESKGSILLYLIKKSTEGLRAGFTSFYPPMNPYLHPFEGKKFQKSVLALRKIGRDCIMRRIDMIKNGDDIPQDILTYMLSNNNETASIEEIVDDFITFYVGGMDTTASAMMFAIILLCQHPNTLERLRQEIKDVLGKRTTVTSKDLEELRYTEQVFFEALRLYPPAFGIPKVLHASLAVKNYTIPAGTEIVDTECCYICPSCLDALSVGNLYCEIFTAALLLATALFSDCLKKSSAQDVSSTLNRWNRTVGMDRKAQYHDDPETFNPDRFHSDHKRPSSFVFFPFGVGQRACIGKHLAIMEGKIVLARLFQTFTITFPEDYELKVIQRLTQQPKDDLLCTMTLN